MMYIREYILFESLHSLEKRAIEIFGKTKNPKLAGYILSDGTLLDFSENNRERTLDHSNIDRIKYDKYGSLNSKYVTNMDDFMYKTGAIRISIDRDSCLIDMEKSPTYNQKKVLENIAFDFGKIIDVDYKRKSYEFSPEEFLDFLDKV